MRLAAVGPATAARITRSHLEVDAIPDSYQAEEILGAIQKHESLDNLRILLARAEVANPQLPKLLEDHGAIVDDVATYQTVAASSASTQESEYSFTPALTGSPLTDPRCVISTSALTLPTSWRLILK